ncbi:MAG TPA: serine/threonine-protein kinase, partial [Thermoanaerobaculia bacterium]|nr:serine/threonine-protein kinase [Thermoanaerobaculia bacterium]
MRCRAETETVDVFSGSVGGEITIIPPGTRLGSRYAIREVLGIGGSSVVYSADDSRTSRAVAVKVLRPDRSTESALVRFRYEAAVARQVDCPHLVRVFDYAEGPPTYLTMELAREGSLRHALKDGPLPVAAAINIAEQVLYALSVLHDRSIVHCDVKPGNILLDGARVVLGDFGLARPTNERLEVGGNESVIGTLEYLAPEQALGRAIDARTDLYALGIVLFEMLTGAVPHRRASSLGTLLAHIQEPAQNVRKLRPATPRWLAALIACLLDKQPQKRYVSANAVLHVVARRRAHYGPAAAIAQERGTPAH